MALAIVRGKNGRRYEVDFDDSPVRVEVYASEETVEIFVEADFETHAEERRRFCNNQHPPPPIQRGYRSDGATRSNKGSLMRLPRLDASSLFEQSLHVPYREAV
jgi:hypothetical protein